MVVCACLRCILQAIHANLLLLGVLVHNLSQRTQIARLPQAHKGKVTGLCFAEDSRLLTCGVDRNVKLWKIGSVCNFTEQKAITTYLSAGRASECLSRKVCFQVCKPPTCWLHKFSPPGSSVDHQRKSSLFATASSLVQVWDETKCVFLVFSRPNPNVQPGAPRYPISPSPHPPKPSPQSAST